MKWQASATIWILLAAACCVSAAAAGLLAQEEFLPPPDLPDSLHPAPARPPPDMDEWPDDAWGNWAQGGCCECRPAYGYAAPWTIRTNGISMKRQSAPRTSLLLDDALEPLVRADALQFDYEGGAELSVAHGRGGGIGATELRFLFFGDWLAHLDGQADDLAIATAPLTPLAGEQHFAMVYSSELFSFELNFVERPQAPLTFLAGFRYIRLDERLLIALRDPNPPAGPAIRRLAHWDTANDLLGGQVGANVNLGELGGALRLQGTAKAGAYLNDARGRAVLRTNIDDDPFVGGVDSGGAAFVGEAGLNLGYDVARHATLWAGYNVLWISGVSLASDGPASTGRLTAGSPLSMTGSRSSVLFHGAAIGVEFRH